MWFLSAHHRIPRSIDLQCQFSYLVTIFSNWEHNDAFFNKPSWWFQCTLTFEGQALCTWFYVSGSLTCFAGGANAVWKKNVRMDIRKSLLCHSRTDDSWAIDLSEHCHLHLQNQNNISVCYLGLIQISNEIDQFSKMTLQNGILCTDIRRFILDVLFYLHND